MSPPPSPKLVLTAILATALGGCAGQVPDPPSLMPRAAERQSLEEPERQAIRSGPVSPARSAQAQALTATATSAVAASRRLTPQRRIDATVGSDGWIAAQTALSAAEAALLPAGEALARLDTLIAAARADGQDVVSLVDLRDAMSTALVAQQTRLQALTPR